MSKKLIKRITIFMTLIIVITTLMSACSKNVDNNEEIKTEAEEEVNDSEENSEESYTVIKPIEPVYEDELTKKESIVKLTNILDEYNKKQTNNEFDYSQFALLDGEKKDYISSIEYDLPTGDFTDMDNDIDKDSELEYLTYILGLQMNIKVEEEYVRNNLLDNMIDLFKSQITPDLVDQYEGAVPIGPMLEINIERLNKLGSDNNIDITIDRINKLNQDIKIVRSGDKIVVK